MSTKVHLAVDAMSGDHGLLSSIPASLKALRNFPGLHLHLVGNRTEIQQALDADGEHRLTIEHSDSVIPMAANVRTVLRSKPLGSSIQKSLDLLKQGTVSGVVSAGNTAALLTLAKRSLGMRPGFSRPALCSAVPTTSGECHMLDLGANVDCRPARLLEFAMMGTALVHALRPQAGARVALLSNGTEASKGNRQVRRARKLLESSPYINFCGFIEADQIQHGQADVVVCDGFAGNIALKAMEGTGRYLRSQLQSLQAGSGASSAKLLRWMNPNRYNGAFLLGLNGVVVKSHGGSDAEGFLTAILQALQCTNNPGLFKSAGE